jgi:dipeptidyl aminopeptidase/acylaminoacyl peptidase
MPLRPLIIPALLVLATACYIIANAGGTTVANPSVTPAPARATVTPSPTFTLTPVPRLPEGVSGRLAYRTGDDEVTVELATLDELARVTSMPAASHEASAGYESIQTGCDDNGCTLTLSYIDGRMTQHDYAGTSWQEWTSDHATLAIGVTLADGRQQVVALDGGEPRVMLETAGEIIEAFSWHGDGLLVALADARGTRLALIDTSGGVRDIAWAAGGVSYFYPSPDRARYVFTQAAPAGWQLWMFDATSGSVSNLGNMGSDPAGRVPPADSSPEGGKGGPMYIAWSPDGSRIAFGGGFEPPYLMSIVDITTGRRATTEFPAGYPGEIHWSPDGSRVAVSTYDIERKHHETWVVDPATGAGRHLMDGCVIVWSPDNGFLAVHGEDRAGISIVDVRTGDRGQLTHRADDTPLSWTP